METIVIVIAALAVVTLAGIVARYAPTVGEDLLPEADVSRLDRWDFDARGGDRS